MALHIPALLVGLLWTTFLWQLWRAFQAGKLSTPFGRYLWLAGFSGALVLTLSGHVMEHQVDMLVGEPAPSLVF